MSDNQKAAITEKLMVVSDREHPHFGCTGYLTGQVISVLGKPMALVQHPNGCQHGTDGFYVTKGQLKEVAHEPR